MTTKIVLTMESSGKQPSTKKDYVSDEVRIEEARKLRALWDAAQHNTKHPLSQAAFGKKYGLGTQGSVQGLLSGNRSLNIDHAFKFADYLCCKIGEFSPRIEDKLQRYVAALNTNEYSDVLSMLTPERAQAMKKYFALHDSDKREIAEIIDAKLATYKNVLGGISQKLPYKQLMRLIEPNERLPAKADQEKD